MKKAFALISLLLIAPLLAAAQDVTITGNLKDVFGANLGNRTFVRFRLRNYGANIPRVIGTGVIVPADSEGTVADLKPDVNGLLTGTLFSNAIIDPAGTYYTVEFYFNGEFQSSGDFTIGAGTFNVSTTVPDVAEPVVPLTPTQIARAITFTQASPSTTWVVTHSFADIDTQCTFYDASNNQIFPDLVTQSDANTVTAQWVVAQAGKAICWNTTSFTATETLTEVLNLNPGANQSGGNGFNFTWDGNLLLATAGQDVCSSSVRCDLFGNDLDLTRLITNLSFSPDGDRTIGFSATTTPTRSLSLVGHTNASASGTGGAVTLSGGLATGTGGTGGTLTAQGGNNSINAGTGGNLVLVGGSAAIGGTPGDVQVDGATAGGAGLGDFLINVRTRFRQGQTLTASTTPSVAEGNIFATNSTPSITNFTGGIDGQIIILLCGTDTTTSLTDASPLFLAGAFTCTADDTISLVFNGTNWYELNRSAN